MPSLLLFWIGWSLLPWGPAEASGGEPATDPLGSLDTAEVQEVFQWLNLHTANPAALSKDALNRAAVRSLLRDGGTGALVLTKTAATPRPPSPAMMARLGETAAYVRLSALDETALGLIRAFLSGLPPEVPYLVLDLRVPLPPGPLTQAATLTSLLLPPEVPLFQIRRGKPETAEAHDSKGPRAWDRAIWLLVDDTTPPVLELAAHVLVRQTGALTLGSPTRGTVTETTDRPLGPDHVLRLPSATVSWPDGSRLSGIPLVPRVPIGPAPDSRAALLALTDPGALGPYLSGSDRPRPNEASLMAGIPAELVAGPPYATTPGPPLLRPDPVLQQAYDLLLTSRFLKLDPPEETKRTGPGR